jgi:hypothetical protein
MVSVYALLCLATLSRNECTNDTAIDVIRLPDAYSELACMRDSEIILAGLAVQPQRGEYWKVVCAEIIGQPSTVLEPSSTTVQ